MAQSDAFGPVRELEPVLVVVVVVAVVVDGVGVEADIPEGEGPTLVA
jgi:hypothetical protein